MHDLRGRSDAVSSQGRAALNLALLDASSSSPNRHRTSFNEGQVRCQPILEVKRIEDPQTLSATATK